MKRNKTIRHILKWFGVFVLGTVLLSLGWWGDRSSLAQTGDEARATPTGSGSLPGTGQFPNNVYLPVIMNNNGPSVAEPDAVPGQYVITWKPQNASGRSAEALAELVSFELLDLSELMSADSKMAESILDSYRDNPDVAAIEPNYIYEMDLVPNDPSLNRQWAWGVTKAYEAWDITQGDANVVIAILDTGIDLDHPDLDDQIIAGYDFVNDDAVADDDNDHGTHVAGTSAAETNNGLGVAGFCPNCKLMPVKVLGAGGSGSLSAIAQGIVYAADNGADVINMSLGSAFPSTTMQNAVDYAWSKGVFVTCAAGNSNTSNRHYPAGYDNCFAVASTTSSDARSSFSNYGNWVPVAAPGSGIYSTIPNGGYASFSGTSMAAPHVAGLAGLLASQGLNNTQIRDRLCDTADQIPGTGSLWTCGRINALEAVKHDGTLPPTATPTNTPVPTNTPTPTATPTATPIPTNTPVGTPPASPTPTNTPVPPVDGDVIINGTFEQGATGWNFSANDILSQEWPLEGSYSAKLGGENYSRDTIDQTVTVPEDGILTYYWYAQGPTDRIDRLRLRITILDVNARYTLDQTAYEGRWYRRRLYFSSSLAGRDVKLSFTGLTNSQYPKAFFVDNVSFK